MRLNIAISDLGSEKTVFISLSTSVVRKRVTSVAIPTRPLYEPAESHFVQENDGKRQACCPRCLR